MNKRNPYIAGLFSLLFPGLGHYYVAETKKAVLLSLLNILFSSFLLIQFFLYDFLSIIIFSITAYVVLLFTIIDAYLLAKKKNEYFLKPYNKWYYYLIMIVVYLLISVSLDKIAFLSPITRHTIFIGSGTSMFPTFRNGDKVVIKTGRFRIDEIDRGTIVNSRIKNRYLGTVKGIQKRVIGLPNETIEIIKGVVYIDGNKLIEPWVYYDDKIANHLDDTTKYIFTEHYSLIQSGDSTSSVMDTVIVLNINDCYYTVTKPPIVLDSVSFYLLGDNRFNSADSREYGPININKIRGKAIYIYRPIWRMKKLY